MIADVNEEYIRLKFYTLLNTYKDQLTSEYFMPSGRPYDRDVVARSSEAVFFDFSRWHENMQDPLEKVDNKDLFARGAVPIDILGVENFLENYQGYWEEVQQQKARYRE